MPDWTTLPDWAIDTAGLRSTPCVENDYDTYMF